MTTIVNNSLKLVDRLGYLQDQIKALQEEESALKDELKNKGEGVQVGDYYTSDVKLSQRTTVDNKALYSELAVPQDLIAKFSKTTAVISISVRPIQGE